MGARTAAFPYSVVRDMNDRELATLNALLDHWIQEENKKG